MNGQQQAALAGWLTHMAVTWLRGWLVGSRLEMFPENRLTEKNFG